ncbi:hypothetical protein R3P38DRAFT_3266869 [Favolaschia claudopus]|uniref:Uncharacterized protein n=1 Tax=Favolaschia claudopus TaxID=2862362 RepID=A0AAW0BSG8_9AGAR
MGIHRILLSINNTDFEPIYTYSFNQHLVAEHLVPPHLISPSFDCVVGHTSFEPYMLVNAQQRLTSAAHLRSFNIIQFSDYLISFFVHSTLAPPHPWPLGIHKSVFCSAAVNPNRNTSSLDSRSFFGISHHLHSFSFLLSVGHEPSMGAALIAAPTTSSSPILDDRSGRNYHSRCASHLVGRRISRLCPLVTWTPIGTPSHLTFISTSMIGLRRMNHLCITIFAKIALHFIGLLFSSSPFLSFLSLLTQLLFGPRVVSRPRASLRLLELRSIGSLWVSFRPSVSFAYGLAVPAAHAERLETKHRSRPQPRWSGRPFPAHTPKTISSSSSPTNLTSTSTYLAASSVVTSLRRSFSFLLPLSRPLRRRQHIVLPRAITGVFVTHPPFAQALSLIFLLRWVALGLIPTLGVLCVRFGRACSPRGAPGDETSLPAPAALVRAAIPRTHPKNHLLLIISYKSDEYVDLPCR